MATWNKMVAEIELIYIGLKQNLSDTLVIQKQSDEFDSKSSSDKFIFIGELFYFHQPQITFINVECQNR
jgi:hypothetical protein